MAFSFQMKRFLCGVSLLITSSIAEFPNSDSPYEAGLPLTRDSSNCSVTLFDNVSLTNYGQVERSLFEGACMDEWSSVVLEFQGSVRGVQFDRAGCVWLDGVELLRTTTPEPTSAGINWFISRELHQYSSLFKKAKGKNTTLQIPNTVDSTYTGALDITIKLTFVSSSSAKNQKADKSNPTPEGGGDVEAIEDGTDGGVWDDVIALAPPTLSSNPWGSMSIQGNGSLSASFDFTRQDITAARLDVYASGHGCEEFWYSNVPNDVGEQYGLCGGGNYREIILSIDGVTAGTLYPFPVIYTGGINPLLWRPMTGIQSFNIPPYSYDLSPFLGVLNEGTTHEFEITVFDNNVQGSWFVDPVLLLNYHDEVPQKVFTGSLVHHDWTAPMVSVEQSSPLVFTTKGYSNLYVSGFLMDTETGDKMLFDVEYSLSSNNFNDFAKGVTYGEMVSKVTSLTSTEEGQIDTMVSNTTLVSHYPYSVTLDEANNEDYLYINAAVNYSCDKQVFFNDVLTSYLDAIHTRAVYNRSNDADRTMYEESNQAHQIFDMKEQGKDSCFILNLAAVNGSTASETDSENKCDNTVNLCADFDACILPPMIPAQEKDKKSHLFLSGGQREAAEPTTTKEAGRQRGSIETAAKTVYSKTAPPLLVRMPWTSSNNKKPNTRR